MYICPFLTVKVLPAVDQVAAVLPDRYLLDCLNFTNVAGLAEA